MKAFLLTVGLVCVAGPGSAAEPLPRYDIDASCRQRFKNFGPVGPTQTVASERYEACFAENQKAYDRLKTTWETTQGWQQSFCVRQVSSEASTPYHDLLVCVERVQAEQKESEKRVAEQERLREIPKKEFRY